MLKEMLSFYFQTHNLHFSKIPGYTDLVKYVCIPRHHSACTLRRKCRCIVNISLVIYATNMLYH